jgi:hypothetical protein
VILSAEKVCRLFRYRSGLAARRLPLHKQHTYSANHKYSHFTPIPSIIPALLFISLQGRYFKGIVTPVNSSLHPSKDLPIVYYFFFSKPTSGAFYTKVLCHAFGNKDFDIYFFYSFIFLR